MKTWSSVEEVNEHAQTIVGKKIKEVVKLETVQKYFEKPENKGWVGNAIESDVFLVPNNSRHEADIPYLNLEIKVTPVKKTRNGWSAKERLVLNIFDFNDEYKREFSNASFIEKATLMELVYYQHVVNVLPPEFEIKAATLFDLRELPEKDILIIKKDWEIIVNKIKEGKAEELSDSLTTYLGATTKGGKSESNMRKQPFSTAKAHQRSFTLKGAYMSQIARRILGKEKDEAESVISDISQLKEKTFEEVIIEKFEPFVGMNKENLGKKFNVRIPKTDDKASSAILARKMLNLNNDISKTEEFQKAGIAVKIVTYDATKKHKTLKTTEGLKLQVPGGRYDINPLEMINNTWEKSEIFEYLSEYKFLLVIFNKTSEGTFFKGVKFWNVPSKDLDTQVKNIWEKTKKIFQQGVELKYKELEKPTRTGKMYQVENNLPSESGEGTMFHIRPSSKYACYKEDLRYAMRLPIQSHWKNRPEGKEDELSDWYMTRQAWWFSASYMYEQIKEFF